MRLTSYQYLMYETSFEWWYKFVYWKISCFLLKFQKIAFHRITESQYNFSSYICCLWYFLFSNNRQLLRYNNWIVEEYLIGLFRFFLLLFSVFWRLKKFTLLKGDRVSVLDWVSFNKWFYVFVIKHFLDELYTKDIRISPNVIKIGRAGTKYTQNHSLVTLPLTSQEELFLPRK